MTIKESEFPRGYLKIYNEILAESKKSEGDFDIEADNKAEGKIEDESGKQASGVVEKPGIKKKKKKSLILPIIIGAAALGTAAMLLGKKNDGGGPTAVNYVSVHLNSTPSGATVFVDGANQGVTTPCDINVAAGRSSEIRLVIERWGETDVQKHFDPDQIYSMTAKLAPYRYGSALDFNTKSNIGHWRWDIDHSGTLYVVEEVSGDLYLEKYDNQGLEISTKKIMSGDAPYNYWVHYNNEHNELYVLDHTSSSLSNHAFDSDGNYLGHRVSPKVWALSESVTGEIFVNYDRSSIKRLNSGFALISTILNGNYWFLKCSDDGEHIFIENRDNNEIMKVDYNGNTITSWKSQIAWIRDSYITSYGTGETEKVFIITGSNQIEIFNGNGEYLTSTESVGSLGKIAEDNSSNIYAFVGNNAFKKYEPSSETEGVGSWAVSSVANKNGRYGTKGITRIGSEKTNRIERSVKESEQKKYQKKKNNNKLH